MVQEQNIPSPQNIRQGRKNLWVLPFCLEISEDKVNKADVAPSTPLPAEEDALAKTFQAQEAGYGRLTATGPSPPTISLPALGPPTTPLHHGLPTAAYSTPPWLSCSAPAYQPLAILLHVGSLTADCPLCSRPSAAAMIQCRHHWSPT
eukprot:g47555.t1